MDRALRARSAQRVDGTVGMLRGELQHFAYRDIADHLETIDRYTTYAARQMHEDGRRAGLLQLAGHPPLAFLRNYIARGGIRDGVARLHHLVDERVLRLPEVREALGTWAAEGRRTARYPTRRTPDTAS